MKPRKELILMNLMTERLTRLREEQASAASWEPRPPFEAAEMD